MAAAVATATTSHYTTVEDEQDDLIVCVVEVRDDSGCLRAACLDFSRLVSLVHPSGGLFKADT
jgi:hypothetical protein